ncbi:PAS domain-containing protein [Pokkaliibacter sp. CJK22405]|uniref:PAS domain-containing protein n=1 Tax=Pokkaliibacter sp. CJK22405 TaxID=3384615 RepID=UPI0039856073
MSDIAINALIFFLLAVFSQIIAGEPGQSVCLWLPVAWGICSCLRQDSRFWGRYVLIYSLISAVVLFALNGMQGAVLLQVLLGRAVEILLPLLLLKRLGMYPLNERLGAERILTILLICIFTGSFLTALFLAKIRVDNGISNYLQAFGDMWLGGACGLALLLPVGVMGSRQVLKELLQPRSLIHFAIISFLLLIISLGIFSWLPTPFTYLMIPLIVLAMSLGGFKASLAALCVGFIISVLLHLDALNLSYISDTDSPRSLWAALAVSGLITALLGVMRDTLKDRGRRLRESESRYRGALTYSSTGFLICSPEGKILDVNPYLCSVLGLRSDSLHHKPLTDIVHTSDRRIMKDALQALRYGTGIYRNVELRLIDGEGNICWCRGRLSKPARSQEFILQLEDISESVVNQANLRRLTERFSLAQRAMKLGVWDINLETQEVFWDEYMYELYGIEDEEWVPTLDSWRLMINPQSQPSEIWVAEVTRDASLNEINRRYRLVAPDGRVRVLQSASLILRDDLGQAVRIVGVNWDITDQSATQERLEAQDRSLQLALVSANAGAWEWAIDSDDGWWADSVYQMFGLENHGIPPDHSMWINCVHPDDRERAEATLFRSLDTGVAYSIEYRVVWPDGSVHWIKDSANVELDTEGKVTRFYGVNIDITASKEIEQALSKARAQLQGIINAATEVSIIATDLNGVITVFNTGSERMLGYSAQSVVGRMSIASFLLEDEAKARRQVLSHELGYEVELRSVMTEKACIRGGRDVNEWHYQRRDGSAVSVVVATTGLFDTQGQLTGFLSIANDISSLKQVQDDLSSAKNQAESANRAKGQFLANMSHEIRTPLNAVLGMAQLLQNTPVTEEQMDYLRMISSSGQALLAILNDVLDFSKIEADRLELSPSQVELDEVIDTVASVMAVNSADKDVELIVDIQSSVPGKIFCDGLRLKQILMNLCSNAIKFTHQGEVRLTLDFEMGHDGKNWLLCEVRDTGIGMTPAQQSRLFVPFNQADNSMTRRFGGTGLGLVISKRLLELMGGELEMQSELNRGTCFNVRLPVVMTEMRRPASASCHVILLSADGKVRNTLRTFVQRLGWRVSCCSIDDLADQDEMANAIIVDSKQPLEQLASILDELPEFQRMPVLLMLRKSSDRPRIPSTLSIGYTFTAPLTPSKMRAAMKLVLEQSSEITPAEAPSPVASTSSIKTQPDYVAHCLLVEDNIVNQKVAIKLLERLSVSVDVAENGAVALDKLRENAGRYDLVLMDVQMPVMDGFAATRAIRHELKLAIPVIALTAGVQESERQQCYSCGMNDFIPKPVNLAVMYEVLHRTLPDRAFPSSIKAMFTANQRDKAPQSF